MRRLDTIKALIDVIIVACLLSLIPIDIRTSADSTVTSVTCLNTMLITWRRDTVTRTLHYVELQSGKKGYMLYEKAK